MDFRRTEKLDIDGIMKIVAQAQEYLKSQGVNQWQDGYPNEERIQEDIDNQWSYVLTKEGNVVGTAAVSFDGEETYDSIYDGQWITHEEYAVIHRIAVDNDYKGLGISGKIMIEIEEICKNRGINSIKIDTHEDNISMQKMLKKNGFQYCGVIYLLDGDKRVAYEKVL